MSIAPDMSPRTPPEPRRPRVDWRDATALAGMGLIALGLWLLPWVGPPISFIFIGAFLLYIVRYG